MKTQSILRGLTVLFLAAASACNAHQDAFEHDLAQCTKTPRLAVDAEEPFGARAKACKRVLDTGYATPEVRFSYGRYLILGLAPEEMALEQLRLAHEAGSTKATTALAWLNQSTWIEDGTNERAINLYEQAVAEGDPVAKTLLAGLLLSIPPDNPAQTEKRAFKLLKEASKMGCAAADYDLAGFYESKGASNIPADKEKSIHYYKRAAKAGITEARETLKSLGEDVPESTRQYPDQDLNQTYGKNMVLYRNCVGESEKGDAE